MQIQYKNNIWQSHSSRMAVEQRFAPKILIIENAPESYVKNSCPRDGQKYVRRTCLAMVAEQGSTNTTKWTSNVFINSPVPLWKSKYAASPPIPSPNWNYGIKNIDDKYSWTWNGRISIQKFGFGRKKIHYFTLKN